MRSLFLLKAANVAALQLRSPLAVEAKGMKHKLCWFQKIPVTNYYAQSIDVITNDYSQAPFSPELESVFQAPCLFTELKLNQMRY